MLGGLGFMIRVQPASPGSSQRHKVCVCGQTATALSLRTSTPLSGATAPVQQANLLHNALSIRLLGLYTKPHCVLRVCVCMVHRGVLPQRPTCDHATRTHTAATLSSSFQLPRFEAPGRAACASGPCMWGWPTARMTTTLSRRGRSHTSASSRLTSRKRPASASHQFQAAPLRRPAGTQFARPAKRPARP